MWGIVGPRSASLAYLGTYCQLLVAKFLVPEWRAGSFAGGGEAKRRSMLGVTPPALFRKFETNSLGLLLFYHKDSKDLW